MIIMENININEEENTMSYSINGQCYTQKLKLNEDNKLYYDICNPYTDKFTSLSKYSFTGRIKDAYEAIKAGYGDMFLLKRILLNGCYISIIRGVSRFVDRDYGEHIRQKTIDGFKDATFKWFINTTTNGNIMPLNIFNYSYSNGVFDSQTLWFDTKEDAEKFINVVKATAKYRIDKALNEHYNGGISKLEFLIDVADNQPGPHNQFTFLHNIMMDLIIEEYGSEEDQKYKFGEYKIEQGIVPT